MRSIRACVIVHLLLCCCTALQRLAMLAPLLFVLLSILPILVSTIPTESSVAKRATCTVTAAQNAGIDDVPAIQDAIASCPTGTIVFTAGITYDIRSTVDFTGCHGCTIAIEGTLKLSDDMDYWEGKTAAFLINGITGATITSQTSSGVIDGNGVPFWTGESRIVFKGSSPCVFSFRIPYSTLFRVVFLQSLHQTPATGDQRSCTSKIHPASPSAISTSRTHPTSFILSPGRRRTSFTPVFPSRPSKMTAQRPSTPTVSTSVHPLLSR